MHQSAYGIIHWFIPALNLLDSSELVVEHVIRCAKSAVEIGLISRSNLIDISSVIIPLLVHPSEGIRDGSFLCIIYLLTFSLHYVHQQCYKAIETHRRSMLCLSTFATVSLVQYP